MAPDRKKQISTSAAATFGVALASMYAAPELNADILPLTYNGGNMSAEIPFDPASMSILNPTDVDQIPNFILTTEFSSTFELVNLIQWNDGAGRTMAQYASSIAAGPQSHAIVQAGDVIDPATFSGVVGNIGQTGLDFEGSAFIAVRPKEAPGNLFWFKLELPAVGSGLPIIYSEGEYGDAGETLTVGGAVQEPCDNPLGDVNADGVTDLLDVVPFVEAITGDYVCEADINQDGESDLLDVPPFVDLLTGG